MSARTQQSRCLIHDMRRFLLCLALATVLSQECLPQRPATTDVVRVTSADRRPVTVVQPVYPEEARKAGINGMVVLDVTIGKTGDVEEVQPISGPKELWASATQAVRQWKWAPYLLNEQPVRVRTKAVVDFVLDARGGRNKKAESKP